MRAPTDELAVADYRSRCLANGEHMIDALFTVTGGCGDGPRWGTLRVRCSADEVAFCTKEDVVRETWYFVDWHDSERVASAVFADNIEHTASLV